MIPTVSDTQLTTISHILARHLQGSMLSVLQTDVNDVATEYGGGNLFGRSQYDRAE